MKRAISIILFMKNSVKLLDKLCDFDIKYIYLSVNNE